MILLPIGIGRVLAFATDEHKLDGCQQLFKVNRLSDDFLRPHGPGFIKAFFVMTSSDNDHPAGILTLTELPEHLDAVHSGHEQIEKDQVGRRLFHHREGLGAVFHAERAIASEAEKLNEQVAHQQLIIDDEDRFPVSATAALPPTGSARTDLAGSCTTRLTHSTSTSSDRPFRIKSVTRNPRA